MSAAAISNGLIDSYGLNKRVEAVKDTRSIGKHDMKYNGATPKMKVDPETFVSNPRFIVDLLQENIRHRVLIGF